MGRDKALLELAGRPLLEHAVTKLRRVCREVGILSAEPAHARFGVTIADLHPGCGPLGGIEAALAHSAYEWNLIMPVDVPFLPAAFLYWWARSVTNRKGVRLSFFRVGEVPQPALLLIHREITCYVTDALARGERRLGDVLQFAAEDFAARRGVFVGMILKNLPIDEYLRFGGFPGFPASEAQLREIGRWFANLNTIEDFEDALGQMDALD